MNELTLDSFDGWCNRFFAAIETMAGSLQVWRLADNRRRILNVDLTLEFSNGAVSVLWTEVAANGGISPNTGVHEARLSDDPSEVAGEVDSEVRKRVLLYRTGEPNS